MFRVGDKIKYSGMGEFPDHIYTVYAIDRTGHVFASNIAENKKISFAKIHNSSFEKLTELEEEYSLTF